jgi:two-component system NtrC family sensor kinase
MTEAFEYADDAIHVADMRGILVRVNPSFLSLYGYRDPGQVLGSPEEILWPPHARTEFARLRERVDSGSSWQGELSALAADGSEVPVRISAHPLGEGGVVQGCICFSRGLEPKSAPEREIFQAYRLSLLGKMGAGLAHELNNPLTSILLDAESLRDLFLEAKEGEARQAALEAADSMILCAKRMRRMLAPLLSHAKMEAPGALSAIPLRRLLEDSLLFMGRQLEIGGIAADIRCDPGLLVAGNRTQMESVFLNLLANSRDAFAAGRTPDKWIGISAEGVTEIGKIAVEYKDNAGGIPPGVLERIFEPFFTTKGGQGAGLGLAVCKRILVEHGGSIRCESSDGETVFRMLLPLHRKSEARSP